MENKVSRELLLRSFKSLQSKFDSSLDEAKKFEADFESLRRDLMHNLTRDLDHARKNIPNENPLSPQIISFIELMENTQKEWDKKVAGRDKGVKFRKGFEDSLLVFVSGKVKSGKSSLGNYIAWGHTDPDESLKKQASKTLNPSFFSHEKNSVAGGDADNEARDQREFRVGATEATSSIQGFKLPGLTWVDSPGLHSIRTENEKLARDYIDHADLILYTTKSDSPGRASDLDEIKQLLSKGKSVIVLITGSDDIEEEGWDDETDSVKSVVVMKDDVRREKQRNYVREALEKVCSSEQVKNIEILSFSARYAQLNEDQPEAFTESGMGILCEKLEFIAQSSGIKTKQQTPLNNLKVFISDCKNDTVPYEQHIKSFSEPLRQLKRETNKKLQEAIRLGQLDLNNYIDQCFDELLTKRDNEESISHELQEINSKLNKKYKEIATIKLEFIFNEIMKGFKETITSTYKNSDLASLPDFKVEKVEEQIPLVRSGSKGQGSLFGGLFGGVIGFFIGGPAGAAVGAGLGSGAGGLLGKEAGIDYKTVQMTVGDNLQDIRLELIRISKSSFEEQISLSFNTLWEVLDRDVEHLLKNIEKEIVDFNKGLDKLVIDINKGFSNE